MNAHVASPPKNAVPQLRLVNASIVGAAFEIRIRATWEDRAGMPQDRDVSVLFTHAPRPRVEFPHVASDAGASLGDDQLDVLVRNRARVIVAWLDASISWSDFRKRGRR